MSTDSAERAAGVSRPETPMFERVAASRISTLIVKQILRLIQAQQLEPGDRLPSERELCTLLGASRSTVREAVRVLESRGLVEVRVGAKGGAHVASPKADKASQGVSDMLATSAISARSVTEARMVIEMGAIPFVCERATAGDIADLREICARAKALEAAGQRTPATSVEFHLRLLSCTHNPALEMIGYALREPLASSLDETQPAGTHRSRGEHEQLVTAIEARNVERATEIMGRHLRRTLRRAAR